MNYNPKDKMNVLDSSYIHEKNKWGKLF